MALAPITPATGSTLVDLGTKTMGYGGGRRVRAGRRRVVAAFALTRRHHFESSAVLFYQERIQSSILSNRQEEVQRNLGDRSASCCWPALSSRR